MTNGDVELCTVEEAIEELGMGRRVRFLGHVTPEELKALYRLARFVVVPSLFEGGGSAVMFEALAEGAALACSDIPTVPEGVRDAALLFDPQSVDSIADTLRRLASDDVLVQELRTASVERSGMYSLRAAAERFVRIYEEAESHRLH